MGPNVSIYIDKHTAGMLQHDKRNSA